jgi:hypothetical protein
MKAPKSPAPVLLHIALVLAGCASTPEPTPTSQQGIPSTSAPSAAAEPPASRTFSKEELDQLVAPIALYPDALLVQILMASTYPLEVVTADRWVKANPGLKEKALEDALVSQPWDASVKSLAAFPQVLTMMSEKIDWTQKLGDAFLAQQKDVLAAAQDLRRKAVAQGTLKTTNEQKVATETVDGTTIIKVEPANPQVVYVPAYNPTVVYGVWPYPAYPPYYYYPPNYYAGTVAFSFMAGAVVGGALWSDCDWRSGDVNINNNRFNNFNRSNVQQGRWSHNGAHRGAVPYRDQRVAQQYGRTSPGNAAAREQFRGRSDAGRGGSAFDTGRGSQARDASNRGSSSLGSARSSGGMGRSGGGFSSGGGFGGGRGGFGGGGRGGGRR